MAERTRAVADGIFVIGGWAQEEINKVDDLLPYDGRSAQVTADGIASDLHELAKFAWDTAVEFQLNQEEAPSPEDLADWDYLRLEPWPPQWDLIYRYILFAVGDLLGRIDRGERRLVWREVRTYYPRGAPGPVTVEEMRPRTVGRFDNIRHGGFTWWRFTGRWVLGPAGSVWLFWDKYNEQSEWEEANDPDISEHDRRMRSTGAAVTVAGGALAGAWAGGVLAGALSGATIGTLVLPGGGTAAGAVIGIVFGLVGAYIGAIVGDTFSQSGADVYEWWDSHDPVGRQFRTWGFDAMEDTGDAAGGAWQWTDDTVSRPVREWELDRWDDVTAAWRWADDHNPVSRPVREWELDRWDDVANATDAAWQWTDRTISTPVREWELDRWDDATAAWRWADDHNPVSKPVREGGLDVIGGIREWELDRWDDVTNAAGAAWQWANDTDRAASQWTGDANRAASQWTEDAAGDAWQWIDDTISTPVREWELDRWDDVVDAWKWADDHNPISKPVREWELDRWDDVTDAWKWADDHNPISKPVREWELDRWDDVTDAVGDAASDVADTVKEWFGG